MPTRAFPAVLEHGGPPGPLTSDDKVDIEAKAEGETDDEFEDVEAADDDKEEERDEPAPKDN